MNVSVFLREDGAPRGAFRRMAIDHTHTIRQDRELTLEEARDYGSKGLLIAKHRSATSLFGLWRDRP